MRTVAVLNVLVMLVLPATAFASDLISSQSAPRFSNTEYREENMVAHQWTERLRYMSPNGWQETFGAVTGDALIVAATFPVFMVEGTRAGFAQVARGFSRGVDAAVATAAGAVDSFVVDGDAMPASAYAAIEGVSLAPTPKHQNAGPAGTCDSAPDFASYTWCQVMLNRLQI